MAKVEALQDFDSHFLSCWRCISILEIHGVRISFLFQGEFDG